MSAHKYGTRGVIDQAGQPADLGPVISAVTQQAARDIEIPRINNQQSVSGRRDDTNAVSRQNGGAEVATNGARNPFAQGDLHLDVLLQELKWPADVSELAHRAFIWGGVN